MAASETNERIDDLIWNMPCTTVFKLATLCYVMKTGKTVMTHKEKAIVRSQMEIMKELQNG